MTSHAYDKEITALLVMIRITISFRGGKMRNRQGASQKRMTAFLTCDSS